MCEQIDAVVASQSSEMRHLMEATLIREAFPLFLKEFQDLFKPDSWARRFSQNLGFHLTVLQSNSEYSGFELNHNLNLLLCTMR